MSAENRADQLKNQFINKLNNCFWYDGGAALGPRQEPGADPIPRTKFVRLVFNEVDEEDQQILENFSNQLSSPETVVVSRDMDHGVIQIEISLRLTAENDATLESDDGVEEGYVWEIDFKQKVAELNTDLSSSLGLGF